MKRIIITIGILISLAGIAYAVDLIKEEPVDLLTPEEGAMAEAKSFGYTADLPKSGPAIKVLAPDTGKEQQSPFRLSVKFVPKPGSSVDPASLKVEALKFVTLDLTNRVKPYVTPEGINMEQAKIPSGNHKLRVTIGDGKGGITQEIFSVRVQ
ncbi:hypothetical protein [Geobacter sp. OR-1]|uniref:hypothetical protein n=1 Tax=Geobacter sp. OR-1 TaxID=1266765 RepID=UPI001269FBB1|nr:hypothetical protein [Geobacter sp. OR-1]